MNRGRPFPDFRMDAAGRTRNDTLNVSFSSPFFAFCLFFVFLSYSSFSSSSSSSSSSFYLKSFGSESNNSNNNNSNNNSSSSSNKCRDAFDFSEATELEFAVDGDLRPVPLVRNGRLMFRLISMKRAIKSPAAMEALLHWPAHRWRADRTEGLDHLWQESPRRIRRFQLDDSIRWIHLGESYQICGREAGRRRRRRMGGGRVTEGLPSAFHRLP